MNNNKYLYHIWLCGIKGIGPAIARRLIQHFTEPQKVYSSSLEELIEINGIGEKIAKLILENKGLKIAQAILEKCSRQNIKIVSYKDSSYPIKIEDNHLPILLYYKGTLKLQQSIAMVGSRRCNEYGKKVTIDIAKTATQNNFTVISGMAKGTDAYAHSACIKNNGYTIAVLAHGLDICYPKENLPLYKSILEKGCLISEYPPGTKIKEKYFIKRNRIIESMSDKIIVTQASITSGSLTTARYAKEYNKELYAVPGEIYSNESMGCNELISNRAKIYCYNIFDKQAIPKKEECKESKLLSLIKSHKGVTIDGLLNHMHIDKESLIEELFKLQLEGYITEKSGKFT